MLKTKGLAPSEAFCCAAKIVFNYLCKLWISGLFRKDRITGVHSFIAVDTVLRTFRALHCLMVGMLQWGFADLSGLTTCTFNSFVRRTCAGFG